MSGRIHLALGGQVVDLRHGQTHAWSLVAGLEPFVGEFVMHRDLVAKVYARAGAQFRKVDPRATVLRGVAQPVGPLTLEIDGGGGPAVQIKGLYVIARMAGDDHLNNETLVVADRRWLWRTIAVERRYNVRRPTPEKRWIDGDLRGLIGDGAISRTEADLTHEWATLRNGTTRWTAADVLADVLAHLCGSDGYTFAPSFRLAGPIQDLQLHDQGPDALGRVLSEIPGVLPYAHPDGRIHLVDFHDGSEQSVFRDKAGAPQSGTWLVQDRTLSLPKQILVGFEREHEIRFNYSEADQTALVSRAKAPQGREEPALENVAPIPDPTLTVDGADLAMGTWVEILEELLPAWEASGNVPAASLPLTQRSILRFYLSGLSPLYATYRRVPGTEDPLLSRRLSAIQEHYRRTFRITQPWMDKLQYVAARRASIVSQETGARARADAFFDYVIKPTLMDLAPRGQTRLGTQVTSYAAQLKDGVPAQADVDVIDSRVGILRITPRVGLTGTDLMVAPGSLSSSFPEADAAATFVLWNQVSLDATWDLAVVLTGVPSVPNDERRLWWEPVTMAEATRALGVPAAVAKGPDRQILCGDTVARIAWLDSKAAEIKEWIWTGTAPAGAAQALLTNPQEVKDVAVAQAARVLSPLLPRVVGRAQVPLDGEIVPTGSLKQVTHGVSLSGSGTGVAWTTLSAPPAAAQPPGVFSLLPERTRRIVARLIED